MSGEYVVVCAEGDCCVMLLPHVPACVWCVLCERCALFGEVCGVWVFVRGL